MKKAKRVIKKKPKNGSSRLSRLILVFRRIRKMLDVGKLIRKTREREMALASYSDSSSSEEAKLSYGFGMAKVISASLLCLILLLTVLFGVGVISYDKVYYMFKDISYIKSFGEGTPDELSYSKPVQNQVFGDFKNGLMVASDSEIKFFTSTGRVTMTSGSELTNPRISTSDGYVLIYDQGRNMFSVYNSFVKLYSENTDYQISNADMSDNGRFLIVTSSKEYRSVVKVYDESFKLVSQYNKNSHIISASLSSNGRYAATVSLSASAGNAISRFELIDCKKNRIISAHDFSGSMPYKIEYLTDDRIALFLDDSVIILNGKGNKVYEYSYPSRAERITVNGDRFAIVFSDEGGRDGRHIVVFDKEGKRTFARQLSGVITDVKLTDSYLYILQGRDLTRINTSLGTESGYRSSKDTSSLVVFAGDKVVLCSQNSADYISFD